MANFTNTAPGMRGINLKDGSTVWVEPGEIVALDAKQIENSYEGIEETKDAPAPAPAPEADAAA